jgi:putative ABC transport system permease protein
VTPLLLRLAVRLLPREVRVDVAAELADRHQAIRREEGRAAADWWVCRQPWAALVARVRWGRPVGPRLDTGENPPARSWMGEAGQDARHGARLLRKSPAFTLVAGLTLALGIGANTAIFSVVNAVVLQPLPFPHPEQLVAIDQATVKDSASAILHASESYRTFLDWQRQSKSFSAMAAYQFDDLTLTGHGEPTVVHGAIISSGLFPTLGVAPVLGRVFSVQDDVKGAAKVVLISENFWRGQLGGDRAVVGTRLELGGDDFTVVGVLPATFHFPDQNPPLQFWIPVRQSPDYAQFLDTHDSSFLTVIGRLAPRVTIPRARAEMTSIVQSVDQQQHGARPLGEQLVSHIEGLKLLLVGEIQPVLLILLGAVGLVVLIACANVANLLLARATGRAREMAVRVALGAGRQRIVRQLLTESVLLGLCAGVAGLGLAFAGITGITSLASDQLPHLRGISVDGWVLAFTFGLSILTGVIFGLAPAWHASEIDLNQTLRESSRGLTAGRRRWTSNALVTTEVALALVLLIGSGLLIKSFYLLTRANPGFDAQNVLTADVALPQAQYTKPEQWNAFFREAVERLEALPGAEGAAAALPIPFTGSNLGYGFTIVGQTASPPGRVPTAQAHSATPGYLELMRIPLIRGRDLTKADAIPNAPKVVVINQTLARRYFANDDPLRHTLEISGIVAKYPARIIGVVGDVKDKTLADPDTPMMYFPYTQESWWVMSFVVRVNGDPASLAGALRSQIHDLDPTLPVQDVQPLTSLISRSEGDARFRSILLGLFGALALVLAAVGIYSVLAYVVVQRRHELGIRIALGAQRADLLRLVITEGMRSVLIGIAMGALAAMALSSVLAKFLYGITDKDPLTFASVCLFLVFVALGACYVPALRAMRVDPVVALRSE